jgi:hypothetical protein
MAPEWGRRRFRIVVRVVVAATTVALSNAFALHPPSPSPSSARSPYQQIQVGAARSPRTRHCASSSGNDERSSGSMRREVRRRQEAELEAMSARGAAKIAQMDISERTKRALLAEAVENRIFALQQEMLELAQSHGEYSVAKTLAKQIRLAQVQYGELVNGDPSDMLRAYDSLASMAKATDEDEEEE